MCGKLKCLWYASVDPLALCVQVKVVAAAAEDAMKAFVQLMNPQAVRVVLPDLLAALDTKKNWQTKIASLNALSELCKRAPIQTAVCLPDMIPAVTAIMGDAKPQVKVSLLFTLVSTCAPIGLACCRWAYVRMAACKETLPSTVLFVVTERVIISSQEE